MPSRAADVPVKKKTRAKPKKKTTKKKAAPKKAPPEETPIAERLVPDGIAAEAPDVTAAMKVFIEKLDEVRAPDDMVAAVVELAKSQGDEKADVPFDVFTDLLKRHRVLYDLEKASKATHKLAEECLKGLYELLQPFFERLGMNSMKSQGLELYLKRDVVGNIKADDKPEAIKKFTKQGLDYLIKTDFVPAKLKQWINEQEEDAETLMPSLPEELAALVSLFEVFTVKARKA